MPTSDLIVVLFPAPFAQLLLVVKLLHLFPGCFRKLFHGELRLMLHFLNYCLDIFTQYFSSLWCQSTVFGFFTV